jgi:hypothetical protein
MIAKSLIAAAAIASAMAVALPATQAQAKTNIDINIGLGTGYGYGGGYWGGGYPVYHPHYPSHISCKKGAKIVRWTGFHNVNAVDCSLPGYKYTGWKNGHKFIVRVNANGNVTGVNKIF